MAESKFLDTAGVSRLWKNVVRKVSSSVDKEKERAQQEEARLEEKIDNIQIAGGGSEYTEGDGIDIVSGENGQKVIKVEENSINDSHIESISFSKITLKDGDTLILNGGNANG